MKMDRNLWSLQGYYERLMDSNDNNDTVDGAAELKSIYKTNLID